jgi:3',5'-cyclic AMP phosphodiesterase CpdA
LFTLAHVSDWHTTTLRGSPWGPLVSKRFFGWLSWKIRRRRIYRPEVLAALFDDLKRQQPDHVAVTGDLTNVALTQEFVEAAGTLASLGRPDWISLIPGNHDAYVAVDGELSWDHWAEYMLSDDATAGEPDSDTDGGRTRDDPTRTRARAPTRDEFPTLRIRGDVALVGVCTSEPTPLFQASGSVGTEQLQRLETLLAELLERELCRVVMIHHPPTDEGTTPRRRLRDSAAFRQTLARSGAELVLYGHDHRTQITGLPGPSGEIPTVGVRSSSYLGGSSHKRAQYHLYRLERATTSTHRPRYHIELVVRGYDTALSRFVDEGEQTL